LYFVLTSDHCNSRVGETVEDDVLEDIAEQQQLEETTFCDYSASLPDKKPARRKRTAKIFLPCDTVVNDTVAQDLSCVLVSVKEEQQDDFDETTPTVPVPDEESVGLDEPIPVPAVHPLSHVPSEQAVQTGRVAAAAKRLKVSNNHVFSNLTR
jgi:hypothetical protein